MTPARRRACTLMLGQGMLHPSAVAMLLWPHSKGWDKVSRRSSTPAGGARGATMPMKAATLLWGMKADNLTWRDEHGRWSLTAKGERVGRGEEA